MTGLIDSSGNQVVSYEYDSWGKPLPVTDTSGYGIGTLNPFRYRGYCYDEETGYYYLKSRYFDPEACRFLSADSVMAGIGGSLSGYNLFAYCFNNPVIFTDADGNWTSCLKTIKKMAYRLRCQQEAAERYWAKKRRDRIISQARKVANVLEPAISDAKNFDWNNTDESKVLESNYFSAYKGKFVLRTNWSRSGSFGILFIRNTFSENCSEIYKEDEVRHEYGHTIQLERVGLVDYAINIGIPSLFQIESYRYGIDYYAQRYEITADLLGGVRSRCYPEIFYDAGLLYLEKMME